MKKLLIANRGEIAIRIARSAAEMGIVTLAIYSEDDAQSLHIKKTDEARGLTGKGPAPYLDIEQIVAIAKDAGADAIHPGYGFLAENAEFARKACAAANIVFVGPSPEALELVRRQASRARVGRIRQSAGDAGHPWRDRAGRSAQIPEEDRRDHAEGRRGRRRARHASGHDRQRTGVRLRALRIRGEAGLRQWRALCGGILPARQACRSADRWRRQSRSAHIWDRECSLQRQRQKIVEIAPAVDVPHAVRAKLLDAAVALAEAAKYKNLGTVEFLVDGERFAFIEANARLQVEHTVTEEVTGLDLVRVQLEIANGKSLKDLHLTQPEIPQPRGVAIQTRINMETMTADGGVKPTGGTLTAYEPPSGRGVRVDGFGYAGYQTSARFDSLLAKLIVHAPSLAEAKSKAYRALCEFKIGGVPTNISFLQNILLHPEVDRSAHTRFIEDNIATLLTRRDEDHQKLFFEPPKAARRAGAKVDASDPLAVLAHGKEEREETQNVEAETPDGTSVLRAPLQGTIVGLSVQPGAKIRAGEQVLVMEAMKMEHVIAAHVSGMLQGFAVEPGDTVFEDAPLAFIEEGDVAHAGETKEEAIDLDDIRPDLAELNRRRDYLKDENRPEAVARRRKTGQRTVRENVEDLCDPDSFVEYSSLVVAGRLRRNSMQELIERTPGDGLVMGLGRVNGDKFPDEKSRVAVMAYDYTVLAGTQGMRNHQKKDRMMHLAEQWRLPVVFFTEGGGGRPGDTDGMSAGGLNTTTFMQFAKLSGLVPLIGINSGYCFAGNAALLGCCDVIIATKNSSIGMGGPAMIEGGGLGVFKPQDVGPVSVQAPNGVIDVVVGDEAEGVAVAKKYLSYFQGALTDFTCADQRLLRRAIPENRVRVYDIRSVIETLFDTGSVLELRKAFGVGMITAFARIEGRPIGIVANNPKHLGGAIDRDGSDKAARFMQLCDAYDIPILMLCDTPGNMVGPEAEKTALVRHNSRLFVIGANVSVPVFTIILRKGYGLGAQGMAGASFVAPFFTISWPTGEFGGMGLEGAVKLGYRNELAAIADPAERKKKYDAMVAQMYERGKAISAATLFEFDEVIDPAETRKWITAGLRSVPPAPKREGKKLQWIDAW